MNNFQVNSFTLFLLQSLTVISAQRFKEIRTATGFGGPFGNAPVQLSGYIMEVEDTFRVFVESLNGAEEDLLNFIFVSKNKKDPVIVAYPGSEPLVRGFDDVIYTLINKFAPVYRYSIDSIEISDASNYGNRNKLRAMQNGRIQIDSDHNLTIDNADECGNYVIYWHRTNKKPRWKISFISWTDLRAGKGNECPFYDLPSIG